MLSSFILPQVNVANSFGEIASGTIWGDTNNLILGFSIVFIYVNFMLGKFNHVEQRVSPKQVSVNATIGSLIKSLISRVTCHCWACQVLPCPLASLTDSVL